MPETGPMLVRAPQPYEELDHTADVGVRVWGATAEETLARLVCAFGALVGAPVSAPATRVEVVRAPAGDLALVAVDVLRELLYRQSVDRLLPVACRVLHVGEDGAAVEVHFVPHEPRGEAELKAVTLHQARFERTPDGWLAQVIFDV